MEKEVKIIIPIAPHTKKNSQRIARSRGRTFIIQSEIYKRYEEECGIYLKEMDINEEVNVKTEFYMPTRRRVDIGNLIAAIHDILVKYKVLVDDNYKIIASVDGSRVYYDKINPRTEITITRLCD